MTQVPFDQNDHHVWGISSQGDRNMVTFVASSYADLVKDYEIKEIDSFVHKGLDYRPFFGLLDQLISPQSYLEIGTETGRSADQFTCNAILIDPEFKLEHNIVKKRRKTLFYQMPSDDFFQETDPRTLIGQLDLGFLDGLHHFEALLRDFINFERHAHSRSIAILHDCLPLNVRMTGRKYEHGPASEGHETRLFWTGDVWRIIPILKEFRPDLEIVYLDCPPTGLVLCKNLDPRSITLKTHYSEIVRRFSELDLAEFGLDALWKAFPLLSSRQIAERPDIFGRFFSLRGSDA